MPAGVLFCISALAILLPTGATAQQNEPPPSCQIAVLRNGFTIEHERREVVGSVTRLWLCSDAAVGYLEIPPEQIVRIEQGPVRLPSPPASSPAVETAEAVVPVNRDSITNAIAQAATRHRIDPDFIASVVKAESGFNPSALSPKGALGLMQLMPQTAAALGVENALDPAANVEGGTRYMRQLLDQYNGDAVKALAAYNAGPARVEQYNGVPPYRETRAYITRVIDDFNRKKTQRQVESENK